MAMRRDKRRYGLRALDTRRGGHGAQVAPAVPTIKEIDIWLAINGVDQNYTNVVQSSTDLNERKTISGTYVVDLDAGDYVEIMFAINDLNLFLNAIAAGTGPATPSIAVNVTQVE